MLIEKIERENFDINNNTLVQGIFNIDDREYKISIGETKYYGSHWIDVEDIIDGQESGSVGSWDHSIYEEVKCVPEEIAHAMKDAIIGKMSINQLGELLYKVLPDWFEPKQFYL